MSRATLVCLIVFVTVCSMSRAALVCLFVFVTYCLQYEQGHPGA